MDGERAAAGTGVVACLLTTGAVAAPYLLLPASSLQYVGRYYSLGAVNPLAVGLLSLLGAIIFAAGREDRSDPDLVAGIMVSVGLFSVVVAAVWVGAFDPAEIGATSAIEFMRMHRWSVLGGTALESAAALWYAAARGLVSVPRPGESASR